MSEFLKLAYELIAKIIYNIVQCFVAIFRLFFTGWPEYIMIFNTYFYTLSVPAKILALLLVLILIAIPILIIVLTVKRIILNIRLRADNEDNSTLYREIGRLNRQVLNLIDEKNKLLALKVNSMGGTERIPYMGASALTDDTIPTVANVTGGAETPVPAGVAVGPDGKPRDYGTVTVKKDTSEDSYAPNVIRFPKLRLDRKSVV